LEKKSDKTKKKINLEIKSLNIDKAEYQQIVKSYTNFPENLFYKKNN